MDGVSLSTYCTSQHVPLVGLMYEAKRLFVYLEPGIVSCFLEEEVIRLLTIYQVLDQEESFTLIASISGAWAMIYFEFPNARKVKPFSLRLQPHAHIKHAHAQI